MNETERRLTEAFEQYKDLVIRNSLYYVKDYYAAEDICQETFVRFAARTDKIPEKKTKAWLLCVSENLSLDHLKKGGKRRAIIGLPVAEELEWDRSGDTDLEDLMIRMEERQTAMSVMELLREKNQDWHRVIWLFAMWKV